MNTLDNKAKRYNTFAVIFYINKNKTRVTVKWWGGVQFAHPYLWKANSMDTEYQEAWNDPRLSEPQQTVSPASNTSQSVNPISEAAKSVTDTVADIASSLGGLFDISLSSVSDETAEEEQFRRRMQRKKQKGRRM